MEDWACQGFWNRTQTHMKRTSMKLSFERNINLKCLHVCYFTFVKNYSCLLLSMICDKIVLRELGFDTQGLTLNCKQYISGSYCNFYERDRNQIERINACQITMGPSTNYQQISQKACWLLRKWYKVQQDTSISNFQLNCLQIHVESLLFFYYCLDWCML